MRVLLLEDDVALSDLLNEHLEDKGYDVTLCTNGQDALEALIDQKYDIALLDINTPIISGIEVLKTIRNEYIHPNKQKRRVIQQFKKSQ